MSKLTIPALLTVGAVITCGCGRKAEERTSETMVETMMEASQGGKAKVDVQDGRMTITTEEGTVQTASSGDLKLPEGFPSDIPLHPGARINTTAAAGSNHMVTFDTDDDVAKVAAAYKSTLESGGWEQKSSMDIGGQRMLAYGKGTRVVSLIIAKGDDGGARVNLTVGTGN